MLKQGDKYLSGSDGTECLSHYWFGTFLALDTSIFLSTEQYIEDHVFMYYA